MHELTCPSCAKSSQFKLTDVLLLCPFCSVTFEHNAETGAKQLYRDHFIVANILDANAVKESALEWLKRIHHKPGAVEKEFFITEVDGFSIPLWTVSLEAHTAWQGLVKRENKAFDPSINRDQYLQESGEFRRNYRWAISARKNICEKWGISRLHEPMEPITVEWDGFPLDSTLSRGRIAETKAKGVYESRNFFEFKYANGIPILGIQTSQQEAIHRAKNHVNQYHYGLSKLQTDYLIDYETEIEIAGLELIHTPIWHISYVYKPKNFLRHFYKSRQKHILLEGHGRGVLKAELALDQSDKVAINAYVSLAACIIFLFLGISWHQAFFLLSLFSLVIAAISFFVSAKQKNTEEESRLTSLSNSIGLQNSLEVDRASGAPQPEAS